MRPIATDECVYVSVYLLVTTVSTAKTMEQIEMPFQVWTRVCQRNRVLVGAIPFHRNGQT